MGTIGQIYSTRTLRGVIRDNEQMKPPSNYWLSLCFPNLINFTDEYVDFSKLTDQRKLAPFVVPTAQGKPIYSAAERLTRVKPAYVKPKDPVSATRLIQKTAGFGELNSETNMSPGQRYDAIIADILRQHRRAIERRWEWMASKAILDASVTLEGEDYPTTVVDFERDANHTVVKTAGNFWGDAGVSILDDVESWKSLCRGAKYGGPTNRLTVGTDVWDVMRKDTEIRELLTTDFAPAQKGGLDLNLGIREGLDVEYVGRLSGTTDVWVYSDYYHDESGAQVPFMSSKDVCLTGPSVAGVRCFGAIQDIGAGIESSDMFPKMWNQEDPSATFVMTQSAPLMVPVNPNNTLKATVLA